MAGRNRPHVLSLQDPQPPILGRVPLPPPRPGLIDDRRLLPPTHPLHRGGPHPSLILEERLAAQLREIHELLLDNQRLAATHVALKQEVDVVQHELHIATANASKANAEKDAEVRELYEKGLRLEGEARLVERMREELAQVRSDIRELAAAREELADRLQGIKAELGRARTEMQQVPTIRAETDTMQLELQKGRAAVEYEKRTHAANLEQSQAMEKNMISMAREVEKLQDELADMEKRARAAAAASVVNPGSGHGGGFGNQEMSHVGAYANVYNVQHLQTSASVGSQYRSESVSHAPYDVHHAHR